MRLIVPIESSLGVDGVDARGGPLMARTGQTHELPTPRSISRPGHRAHVWCKSCRSHAKDAGAAAPKGALVRKASRPPSSVPLRVPSHTITRPTCALLRTVQCP